MSKVFRLILRVLPHPTLFPYTTLFRSRVAERADAARDDRDLVHLVAARHRQGAQGLEDRKSTRLNSSHTVISYAVFCLKKKKHTEHLTDSPSPTQIKSITPSAS